MGLDGEKAFSPKIITRVRSAAEALILVVWMLAWSGDSLSGFERPRSGFVLIEERRLLPNAQLGNFFYDRLYPFIIVKHAGSCDTN